MPSMQTSAGKIIGKSGSIVNNIRQKTKARVINAQPAVTGSLWAPVVVIGEWASIVSAYGALSELVDGGNVLGFESGVGSSLSCCFALAV